MQSRFVLWLLEADLRACVTRDDVAVVTLFTCTGYGLREQVMGRTSGATHDQCARRPVRLLEIGNSNSHGARPVR